MSQNTVKIVGNYIEVCFIGDQTYEGVKDVGQKAQAAAETFMAKDEWVRVLADLSKQGKINAGSMRASKEIYNYGTYDRMVFVGFNAFMSKFLNGVIKASRRESSVRLENDREKAIEWLLENPKEIKI